ncbi:hypothetical protein RRF94_27115 [Escherichia coli]|nr:hypothetical protein [Escherichia coli]MDT8590289.1 hypothetical protein [Escherichia coli]
MFFIPPKASYHIILKYDNTKHCELFFSDHITGEEPRQPGGCKLKTAPVRPVVAARPAEYVCSEDLFY